MMYVKYKCVYSGVDREGWMDEWMDEWVNGLQQNRHRDSYLNELIVGFMG